MSTYNIFKKKHIYFAHENMKKLRSKVAYNQPQNFFSQVRAGCTKQPRIDFSYYKMSQDSSVS
jgi:hypothetical protein